MVRVTTCICDWLKRRDVGSKPRSEARCLGMTCDRFIAGSGAQQGRGVILLGSFFLQDEVLDVAIYGIRAWLQSLSSSS